MSRLADTQRALRDAIVSRETGAELPALVGGRDPAKRLAIHQRHYRASLVGTLLTRFPGLSWLVGGKAIAEAAEGYVRIHPPCAPCLTEYGDGFPAFVARHLGHAARSYIQPFGELEWHVGSVSIAVDVPVAVVPYPVEADALASGTATLQPGVRYLRAEWPVHDLLRHFLANSAPAVYELHRSDIWIEVRGARGEFVINTLDAATWTFRHELRRGGSLEDACLGALATDDQFDPGAAVAALLRDRLLASLSLPSTRSL
jgi:Putative DNA-binding domain